MKKRFKYYLAAIILVLALVPMCMMYIASADEDDPTGEPGTEDPTGDPTGDPTDDPTEDPTDSPTEEPTVTQAPPTAAPTPVVTAAPEQPSGGNDGGNSDDNDDTPEPEKPEEPEEPTPTVTEPAYPGPDYPSDVSIDVKSAPVIKVDGIYEDLWDEIESVPIQNIGWGTSGASGSFKTYWEAGELYVLVDVTDTTNDTASKLFSRKDCVEVFINENGTKPAEYGEGDSHYKISRSGQIEYGNGGIEDGIDYAVIEKTDGYMVEIGVKFRTITPSFGQAIGFDVRINDSQGDEYRDFMLQWSDTSMYTFEDLSKIGTVYLK